MKRSCISYTVIYYQYTNRFPLYSLYSIYLFIFSAVSTKTLNIQDFYIFLKLCFWESQYFLTRRIRKGYISGSQIEEATQVRLVGAYQSLCFLYILRIRGEVSFKILLLSALELLALVPIVVKKISYLKAPSQKRFSGRFWVKY